MEDLLQSQIKDSCKLALPEGLRDLMSDISREVLRARPHNLYQFIADYLAAMLVARDTLTIANHVCKEVCNCGCEPELDDELRNIGLTEDEVEEAKNIITRYLEKDKVKEESLFAKLLRTNIDEQKLPDIQKAVKAAYKRNLAHRYTYSGSSDDDVTRAAKNTLQLYLKSGSTSGKDAGTNDKQIFNDAGRTKYDQTTEASSSNSSQCIFKDIIYDGGIKDLYVSKNCKPYKNSSLTSLAGSYGTPLINKEHKIIREQLEEEKVKEPPKASHKRSEKKPGHIDFIETTDKAQVTNVITEEIVKGEKFEESGDGEFEIIDDEVLFGDDESDTSIIEDINED